MLNMNNAPFEVIVKPGETIRTGMNLQISDATLEAEAIRGGVLPPGFTGAVACEDAKDGRVLAVRCAPFISA